MTRWVSRGEIRLAVDGEGTAGGEVRERIVSTILPRELVMFASCFVSASESWRREARVPVCEMAKMIRTMRSWL